MKTSFDLIKSYCETLKALFERQGVKFDRINDIESIELLEQSVSISERILRKFCLPNSNFYIDLLPWAEVYMMGENEIHRLIARLENESKSYFEEVVKPDVMHLEHASILGYKAEDVLDEMGMPNHVYLEFLYNCILRKNADTAKNILLEMKKVSNEPWVLKNIALAGWSSGDARESIMRRLEKYDVTYLDEFLDFSDSMQFNNLQKAVMPVYVCGSKVIFIERADEESYHHNTEAWCICVDFKHLTIEGPDTLKNMLLGEAWFQLHESQHERMLLKLVNAFNKNEIFEKLVVKFYELAA
jgi:hypothetical protein